MKIKLDKADVTFSKFIRLRDGRCVRCGRRGDGNNGINGLQASHYFGRGKESTRFDPENVDALCFGCHQYWGSTDREAYRDFKLNQLGDSGLNALVVRANTLVKKDRKMSYLIAKGLLDSLTNDRAIV